MIAGVVSVNIISRLWSRFHKKNLSTTASFEAKKSINNFGLWNRFLKKSITNFHFLLEWPVIPPSLVFILSENCQIFFVSRRHRLKIETVKIDKDPAGEDGHRIAAEWTRYGHWQSTLAICCSFDSTCVDDRLNVSGNMSCQNAKLLLP